MVGKNNINVGEISFHRARSQLYGKTGAETISEEKAAVPERGEICAPSLKAETEALSEKGECFVCRNCYEKARKRKYSEKQKC